MIPVGVEAEKSSKSVMGSRSMKVILGSQSKGRRKMLTEMRVGFEIMPADIDERAIRHSDPKELVIVLARAKAEALKLKIFEPVLLITSDQVVVCQGRILEKPLTDSEARNFLLGYNTKPAETVTGVVVSNLENGKVAEGVDVAKVYFKPFSNNEINELIAGKEVFNYAGGFTIDGDKWFSHVKRIEGSPDSVLGLPKKLTKRLIHKVTK